MTETKADADAPGPPIPPIPPLARPARLSVRQRSWAEVRWRQFRNAPRPIVRAVLSSLLVAIVLGAAYLAYDVALRRGVVIPGGDLRVLFIALDVIVVLTTGSIATYVFVPQPTGSGDRVVRTGWSAALGLFAAVPVCYLVLVVAVQVIEPLLA
jgi:hypothetical protein